MGCSGAGEAAPQEVGVGPMLLGPVNPHNWEALGAAAEIGHHPRARLPALPLPLAPRKP